MHNVDAELLSRTIVASSEYPGNEVQCAAFCRITASDCMFHYFDSANSVCFAGILNGGGGAGMLLTALGPITVTFQRGVNKAFYSNYQKKSLFFQNDY